MRTIQAAIQPISDTHRSTMRAYWLVERLPAVDAPESMSGATEATEATNPAAMEVPPNSRNREVAVTAWVGVSNRPNLVSFHNCKKYF